MLILIAVVFLNIVDWWIVIGPFIAFDLPPVMNWAGLIGLWFYLLWGTATLLYNINYTPLYHEMEKKKQYVLATGGPYSIIRHPMYVAKGFVLSLLVFLTTGSWLVVISMIGWPAFHYQAVAEEKLLNNRFGKKYTDYVARTGRFFPKISW